MEIHLPFLPFGAIIKPKMAHFVHVYWDCTPVVELVAKIRTYRRGMLHPYKTCALCQTGTCPSLFGCRFANMQRILNPSSSMCSGERALTSQTGFMTK